VVEFLRRYDLDGLDIDWEYPGQPGAGHKFRVEDKQNFTALVRELRQRFDREGRALGRHLALTMAAGSGQEFLDHTEMGKAQQYLDTVNLMTYDYSEPGEDKITGHNAPLYANPADPRKVSSDESVRLFLKAGVPARKLLLGAPFYGHVWGDVPATANGLFQPGGAVPKGYASYGSLKDGSLGPGYVRYWDDEAKVPYLYNAEKKLFVSYEDTESIQGKAQYVLSHKLGGVMFWSYESDPTGDLLRTLNEVLRPGAAQKEMH
jgi:chitinase